MGGKPKVKRIIMKDPEIKPSIPSMKLIKLIKAIDNYSKNKKNTIRSIIDSFSYLKRKFKMRIDEVNI